MRRLTRWLIRKALIPALDSLILWAFGWRREYVGGLQYGPHYIDPLHTERLYLRDWAVKVAVDRARAAQRREVGNG